MQTQERVSFYRAREDYDRVPGNTEAIATMMEMALEAISPHVRHLASRWLMRVVGVIVVDDEEGSRHAAPAPAAGIC